jgi:hypothetical protein
MADADATAADAVSTASHRISLPAFIARPGFVAKEPLREGPPLEAAALVARLEQLLHSDPARFLERYGQWLLQEELAPFEGGGYECTWHLARLRRSTQQREQERRNRRFHCMAEMLRGEGSHADYFSLERMQAWGDAPDCSHATRYVHAPRHATPRHATPRPARLRAACPPRVLQERAPALCRHHLGTGGAARTATSRGATSQLPHGCAWPRGLVLADEAAAAGEEEQEEEEEEDEEQEEEEGYEARAWEALQQEDAARGQAQGGAGGGGGGGAAAAGRGRGAAAEGEGEGHEGAP